ncbi:hypothetical protein CRUP_001925 [Coryphaenoides rupestris]|nr:hypothetical protein CRUP_001925 [Coryphaenoides rupestris]
MDDFDMLSAPAAGNGNGGGSGSEEDPAAAFLAQQESDIAGIENDEGFSILDGGEQESNGPSDSYAAISHADRLQAEPESLRKWREEQRDRLEVLDDNSRAQESAWKDKAQQELEEWHSRQNEQLEKTKVNNRVLDEDFYTQPFSDLIGQRRTRWSPTWTRATQGTEWERVARLCDFNPKSSKQAKDVSRMRSVLISLKQAPLAR